MTTTSKILQAVTAVFNVSEADLLGRRRRKHEAEARLAAGYFMLTTADLCPDDVNRLFKKTRHWASWALYRCPDLAEVDRHYQRKVAAVHDRLQLTTATA